MTRSLQKILTAMTVQAIQNPLVSLKDIVRPTFLLFRIKNASVTVPAATVSKITLPALVVVDARLQTKLVEVYSTITRSDFRLVDSLSAEEAYLQASNGWESFKRATNRWERRKPTTHPLAKLLTQMEVLIVIKFGIWLWLWIRITLWGTCAS